MGVSTRILHYATSQPILTETIAFPDGRKSMGITALRVRAERHDSDGRVVHLSRLMDVLHIAPPHQMQPNDPLGKMVGWLHSPQRMKEGRNPAFAPEGTPDPGHQIGRLWDLVDGMSFLCEEKKIKRGFILAARSVENGQLPTFQIENAKWQLPKILHKEDMEDCIRSKRHEIESVLRHHLDHPAGATISPRNVLYLRGEAYQGLRLYENGSSPQNLLDAIAPLNGQPATKTLEIRSANKSASHTDEMAVIHDRGQQKEIYCGEMFGLAFPKLRMLVRAQIKGVSQKNFSNLTEQDALDAGARTLVDLQNALKNICGERILRNKPFSLLRFKALERQPLSHISR